MPAARAWHGGTAGLHGSSCPACAWVFNRDEYALCTEGLGGPLRLAVVDHVRGRDGLVLLSRDAAAQGAQRPALHPCFHALKIFLLILVFTIVDMANCHIHDETGTSIFRKIQMEVERHSNPPPMSSCPLVFGTGLDCLHLETVDRLRCKW